ncbi:MAG TPA: thioesterase domain-containing protein [Ktedonobacteraceae bacterium]|nr:thioesterase domain-containing protein [Ktedonobacteraceae bacterium]HEV2663007.1 thioesterase domain-containing protein [Ktedonobacteraceae bacterium]
MDELLQALQQTLAQGIPITHHMGILAANYDETGLVLKAPLAGNTNPKGTAFAGSINALLTLAGWGLIWLVLKELDIPGDIVIQNSTIGYVRPVTDDFAATCHRPAQADIERIEQALKKKGKARIELSAEIYQDERIAAEFKGRYVIHLSQNPPASLPAWSAYIQPSIF